MRGDERAQGMMFATVVLEDRIPASHPLRDLDLTRLSGHQANSEKILGVEV